MQGKWTQEEWDYLSLEQCESLHLYRSCEHVDYVEVDDVLNLIIRIRENKN